MTYRDLLRHQLRIDEAERGHPYDDATGERVRAPRGNLTVGIGHNLDAKPLTPAAQAFILEEDIDDAEALARTLIPNFWDIAAARQAALVNMAFNLGEKLGEFAHMLAAVRDERWDDAAREMLDSAWAKEVGDRARRLEEIIRTGAS